MTTETIRAYDYGRALEPWYVGFYITWKPTGLRRSRKRRFVPVRRCDLLVLADAVGRDKVQIGPLFSVELDVVSCSEFLLRQARMDRLIKSIPPKPASSFDEEGQRPDPHQYCGRRPHRFFLACIQAALQDRLNAVYRDLRRMNSQFGLIADYHELARSYFVTKEEFLPESLPPEGTVQATRTWQGIFDGLAQKRTSDAARQTSLGIFRTLDYREAEQVVAERNLNEGSIDAVMAKPWERPAGIRYRMLRGAELPYDQLLKLTLECSRATARDRGQELSPHQTREPGSGHLNGGGASAAAVEGIPDPSQPDETGEVKKPENIGDYRSATVILNQYDPDARVCTQARLIRVLNKNPQIKWHRPRKQRLMVQLADWLLHYHGSPSPDPDPSPATVERRKAEIRKKKRF